MAAAGPPRPQPDPAADPTPPRPAAPVVNPAARTDYAGQLLDDAVARDAPLVLLARWYADAVADPRVGDPAAMVVATVDADGLPDARTVLLKGLDAAGLTFFTNLGSAKASQLAARPAAALVLPWHDMHRQLRVRGQVEELAREEVAAYFASRPHGARLGAWASRQSHPLASRGELLDRVAELERRWPPGTDVPLPPHWGGYRVRPVEVEAWVGQASRLHDRLVWTARDGVPAALDDAAAWRSWRRQP